MIIWNVYFVIRGWRKRRKRLVVMESWIFQTLFWRWKGVVEEGVRMVD